MPSRTSAGPPPRVPCVSRHIKRDQFRASIAPGVHARGLGSKANVLPRQGSPSRRTRRRRGLQVGIRSHLRTLAPSHPSMRTAATAARCVPKLVAADAHVLPVAHGLRISIRCVTADPDGGRRLGWTLPGRCAPHTPPGKWPPWRAIHPPTPGGRVSSPAPPRLAPDARCGLGTPPKRTESRYRGAGPHPDPSGLPHALRRPRQRPKGPWTAPDASGGGGHRLASTLSRPS